MSNQSRVPQRSAPDKEYSLYGSYQLIEQGFGVCDRVADELNFGLGGQCGEIMELVRTIRPH